MAKPSVLFINRVYPPSRGATGRVLRDLARGFARDGWDVTVVTTGPYSRRETDGPVRIVRVRGVMKARTALAYMGIWAKLFRTAMGLPRHDLIVTMTDPPMLVMAGRLLSQFKKSRHIHWCQDLYPDLLPYVGLRLPQFMMGIFKALSRRAMKKCDKVVVVGRCMARHLTHSGMDPQRIAVIPNWPDPELLNPQAANTPGRRMLHIREKAEGARAYEDLRKDSAQKFRVLYSGNLGRAHPLETILGAAEILSRRNPEIEFVFVGDGPGFDWLARERARRNLDNLRLMPYQPASRLREIMESGDLHIVTMKHEVEGMLVPCKFYSALAASRPVLLIGPDKSEMARVIRDFAAGDIVPQGDPEVLANAILRFRMNSEDWFRAYEGASRAGKVFVPRQSIGAWLDRARVIVNPVHPAPGQNRDAA